ncbi:MAG: hypothetical protein WKF43_05825 [Acidimicrobiales bacterium]
MRAKQLFATAIAATTLGAGGLAVAALNPSTGVGAQEEVAPGADSGTATETTAPAQGRGRVLEGVLGELVTEGTLTQAQADAVKDGVKEQAAEGEHRRPRRGQGMRAVASAAEALGIAPRELLAELKAGRSIADVAVANDVEPQAVIDALVAAATTRLDQAVANGNLDEAHATKLKERLPDSMEKLVNRTRTPR